MQIQKCDECGALGEPGDTWITVSVTPFYIQGNQFRGPEIDCVPERLGSFSAVCSPVCAITRLKDGFYALRDFSTGMLDEIKERFGDDLAPVVHMAADSAPTTR